MSENRAGSVGGWREAAGICHKCGRGTDRSLDECGKMRVELRPYGPGGSWVCFECAFATPESKIQTEGAHGALLDAAGAIGAQGVAVIGDGNVGPVPATQELLDAIDAARTQQ